MPNGLKKTLDDLESEAKSIGLDFIGPYAGIMGKSLYSCLTHGEFLQTANKVQQGIGCQRCGRERQFASRRLPVEAVSASAERVGLIYLSGYTSINRPAKYRCAEHGEITAWPSAIAAGGGCKKCGLARGGLKRRKPKMPLFRAKPIVTLDALRERAVKAGLAYVDELKTSHEDARYACPEHGEIFMRPASVRRGSGCRFCSGNVQKSTDALSAEATAIGLDFIGPVVGDGLKTAYRCSVHGEIQKRPGDVAAGKGCRHCAKYGPDVSAPGVFYLYRIDGVGGPSFLGYGITKDHLTRDRAHKAICRKHGLTADLVMTIPIASGAQGMRFEQHLRRKFLVDHIETDIRGFKREAMKLSAEPAVIAEIAHLSNI